MSKNKGRSQRGFLPWWITVPVFLIVCGSLFVNLVQYQVSIASKQQELQSVQNQLSTQLTENAELSGTLDQGESAIIERYAGSRATPSPTSASLWTSAANKSFSAGTLCGSPLA